MQLPSSQQLEMGLMLNSWCVSLLYFSVSLVQFRVHRFSLTSSSPVSWVFGWRLVRFPSRSRAKHSCRLIQHLQGRAPWLLLTHSWWTWAHPPRTRLHPGHCGGGGDDGQWPGLPRHPVAPPLPAATVASCWLRPHLRRKKSKFHYVIGQIHFALQTVNLSVWFLSRFHAARTLAAIQSTFWDDSVLYLRSNLNLKIKSAPSVMLQPLS